MTLDVLANVIAVFVGHDDISDHDIWPGLFNLDQGQGSVMAGDNIDVLAPEGDLDHLAHGGAVIDEIHSGGSAHRASPPSESSCAASSRSPTASTISCVAYRS